MALRLIEMVLPEGDGGTIQELLREKPMLEHRQIRLPDEKVLVRILLEAEQSEAILDLLGTTVCRLERPPNGDTACTSNISQKRS